MANNAVGDSWSFGGENQTTDNVMTGTTKLTGKPVVIEQAHGVAWTMRWTGTPTGTFSVEVSNQYDPQTNPTPNDWTQYTLTIPAGVQPAGAYPTAGSGIDLAPTSFRAARLCYTNASGAGVLTSRAHVKGY
jgi:hypothetical protein